MKLPALVHLTLIFLTFSLISYTAFADHEEPLIDAAFVGNLTQVKALIKKGLNVNHQGKHEETALIAAAVGGHEQVARTLIKNGADLNIQDISGFTALETASGHGSEKVALLLKDAGATK